ncbi:MAG: DUF465 domain-containing protein [Alphaproteobacteria bacterium]|nr:DUF465 domain-containing protein [Alphaproteobacteria bacterium]
MSVEGSVDLLRSHHQDLEAELAEEMRRPHPDEARIAELKKKKLRLKDEIARRAITPAH